MYRRVCVDKKIKISCKKTSLKNKKIESDEIPMFKKKKIMVYVRDCFYVKRLNVYNELIQLTPYTCH